MQTTIQTAGHDRMTALDFAIGVRRGLTRHGVTLLGRADNWTARASVYRVAVAGVERTATFGEIYRLAGF